MSVVIRVIEEFAADMGRLLPPEHCVKARRPVPDLRCVDFLIDGPIVASVEPGDPEPLMARIEFERGVRRTYVHFIGFPKAEWLVPESLWAVPHPTEGESPCPHPSL